MKESISQAFIVNLILFFFVILILLYFGSINFSKAYKSKNRIINTIEKYGEWNSATRDAVAEELQKTGYQTRTLSSGEDISKKCIDKIPAANSDNLVYPVKGDFVGSRGYDYCVVEFEAGMGKYYQVVAFMKFEVPVVGGLLEFAVRGETKALYNNIEG